MQDSNLADDYSHRYKTFFKFRHQSICTYLGLFTPGYTLPTIEQQIIFIFLRNEIVHQQPRYVQRTGSSWERSALPPDEYYIYEVNLYWQLWLSSSTWYQQKRG